MADNTRQRDGRIDLLEVTGKRGQTLILGVGKRLIVTTLQLNTDGKIIALLPSVEAGLSRVPGLFIERNILSELTMAVNQRMRGHPQIGDISEVRVRSRIQLIAKQIVDPAAAVLPRRQTDIVDDQQINLRACWPLAEIGRHHVPDVLQIPVQAAMAPVLQPVLAVQAGVLCDVLKSILSITPKPVSMSDNHEQKPGRHAGLGMLIISFALGLGLLTLFFDDMLGRQFNPNQRPSTQALQDGGLELVLQRNRQGHYVMSGDISGEPATFLLDTGATDVVIPAGLADSAGLQPGQAMRAMTANGLVTVYTTTIPVLHLGEITLYDVRASINPAMQGDTVLLGMSALRHVEFTQRAGTLILRMVP